MPNIRMPKYVVKQIIITKISLLNLGIFDQETASSAEDLPVNIDNTPDRAIAIENAIG